MNQGQLADAPHPAVKIRRVTFMSRRKAEALLPGVPSAIISIYDVSEQPAEFQRGWLGVLYLRFHDTDGGQMGLETYNRVYAAKALAFVMEHGGTAEHLVVRCNAGQSRSAGMALMLSEALRVPCFKESLPVNAEKYNAYNRLVYSMTWRAAMSAMGDTFLEWSGNA